MDTRVTSSHVYVVVEDPTDGWVKVGLTKGSAADRFRGGKSTDNPRRLVVHTSFPVANPLVIEQSAHRMLRDEKFEHAAGGHEWWRCTPEDAVRAVNQALGGEGRQAAPRWRRIGPIESKPTGVRYPKFRWIVGWLDDQKVVHLVSPRSGAPSIEQAEAHLERHLLPPGMIAAVLWDREEGTRLRYDAIGE